MAVALAPHPLQSPQFQRVTRCLGRINPPSIGFWDFQGPAYLTQFFCPPPALQLRAFADSSFSLEHFFTFPSKLASIDREEITNTVTHITSKCLVKDLPLVPRLRARPCPPVLALLPRASTRLARPPPTPRPPPRHLPRPRQQQHPPPLRLVVAQDCLDRWLALLRTFSPSLPPPLPLPAQFNVNGRREKYSVTYTMGMSI